MNKHGLWLAMAAMAMVAPGCGGESSTDAGIDSGTGTDTGGTDAGSDAGGDEDAGSDAGTPSDAPIALPDGGPPVGDAVVTFAETCPAFAACGGDVVGTWNYEAICIENGEIEALFADMCPGTEVLSGSGSASGVVTITASDISRVIDTSITAVVQVGGATCIGLCTNIPTLIGSLVPGATATCEASAGGCTCAVTFTSSLDESNGYTIEGGDTIVTTDKTPRSFEYCVEGDGSLRVHEVDGEPGTSTSMMAAD